jgi:hypothetical protein
MTARTFTRLALAACVLLAAGIVTQLLRHSDVVEHGYEDVSCRRFLPEGLMGTAMPNCDGTRDLGEGPVPIHFNSRGFRDTEHSPFPPKGTFRVALLGASVHVAPGLPEEANPARLIEARLAELGLGSVEVMNFSVEGFATIHHLANFHRYLTAHPHLVLVDTLDGNKPFRDLFLQSFENPEAPLGSFHPFRSAESLLPYGLKWISKWKAPLRFYLHLKQVAAQLEATRELQKAGTKEAQAKLLLGHSLDIVNEMKRQGRKYGADIAILWHGEPLTNTVALRQNESTVLAQIHGPLLAPISVPAPAALAALGATGMLVADISAKLPSPGDRRLYLGASYYYSRAGMERYAQAVAEAIAPIIRNRLAHPPRPETLEGSLSSRFR